MFEKVDRDSLISQEFIAKYKPYFREESYAAKTVLLEEGEVANKVF